MEEIRTATDHKEKTTEQKRSERREMAFRNNAELIEVGGCSNRMFPARITSARIRRAYAEYLNEDDPEIKFDLAAELLDLYDNCMYRRSLIWGSCMKEDVLTLLQRAGRNRIIDHSDRKAKDYYSVAVIVKNEARYMREFVLFYLATGADRIYVYDNESSDDLLDVLEPFLKSGEVIYTFWPGKVVQTAAYRDAVRRTRNRSRWLALIDADEFLFSPRGSMPEQLKKYEEYPGVCANWLLFGPNGHDRRPEGLVMDNYTTTMADHDYFMHCHVKSIVQPARVWRITSPHFSYYKGGDLAVNEERKRIDNSMALAKASGRAFTEYNCNEVFRINHYITRSLEDLEDKCTKGRASGSQDVIREKALEHFLEPQVDDLTIKPYADIVRMQYEDMG